MPDLLSKLTRRPPTPQALPEDSELEQFFTDAERARQVFEDLIRSAPAPSDAFHPQRLLVIHGVGGVGKSTLLKMYRLSCYRHRVPVALVGAEDAPSPVDVLASWAEDLSRTGVKLRVFPSTLDHYRALQAQVEARAERAKETMRGAAGALGKVAARTAVEMAASAIPVVGPLAAALGGAGTEAAIDWLRGFLSKPDLALYLDPSQRLTDDFLADLARAAARQRGDTPRPIVLMADTYEQMAALDEWMRELARRLPDGVLLVLAGRAVPEWDRAWPGWMGRAEIVALQEMPPDDLHTLVRRYYAYVRGGEPDPAQVEAIVTFARGLPIAATTVVQLWIKHGLEDFEAVKPQVVADLVDRLLEGVPPDVRPAFEAAAVLRYFDADGLGALLEDGDAERLYAELRRWPFVRPRREGLAVHGTMREMINEALWVRAPARFCTLHERAAAHYEARLEQAAGDARERLVLERLYHRVCADEDTGVHLFQEAAEELARYHLIDRLRTLLNDAHTYPLNRESSRLWRAYYAARLDHLEARLAEAEEMYRAIGEDQRAEPRLRAYALCDWGQLLSHYGKLGQPGGTERATEVLEQSLNLVPLDAHLVRAFFHLARVHRYQARWDEQTALLERAQAFFEQQGDDQGLAYVYSEMEQAFARRGLWKDLFTTRERLQGLSGHLAESAALRNKILRWSWNWAMAGRLSESERDARERVSLARSLDDAVSLFHALRDLGWILGHQGRYAEADRSFSDALEIAQGLGSDHVVLVGSVLGFWGAVLIRQGKFDQAGAHLTESLAIKERIGDTPGMLEPLVWLGRLHEAQGKADGNRPEDKNHPIDEAHAYYRRCLELEWLGLRYFHCEALAGLVRVTYARGQYDAVPPLAARVEALARQHEYNDHLAALRLMQGHAALDGQDGHVPEWSAGFDAALNFYQQALIHALRYNRFLLDEVLWGGGVTTPLRPIAPHCLARGESGRRMLAALRDWWATGTNATGTPNPDTISPIPEGIPLPEAERLARQHEPGDRSPQRSVVETIERALICPFPQSML